MKKINFLLKKCKSLSRQLARSSSSYYNNLRSKSCRQYQIWGVLGRRDGDNKANNGDIKLQLGADQTTTIFVGSAKKRYIVSAKHLSHPLFEALLDKSSNAAVNNNNNGDNRDRVLVVKCEVVLFDHLLWMLENADPISLGHNSESLEELAALYVF